MPFPRLAGVILHPTSLPGGHGVGDLGPGAFQFVDFLHQSGIGLWQILPLGPTGGSHSPYQSLSSFAGNPLLISLDLLAEEGLLGPADLEWAAGNGDHADHAAAYAFKNRALRAALAAFDAGKGDSRFTDAFESFEEAERWWLDDFAVFIAAKQHFEGAAWFHWKDKRLRRRDPETVRDFSRYFAKEIRFHKFCQYAFFSQWRALKAVAAMKRIRLIGDVPIYCAHDSADVWASPKFFQLDDDGNASFMAGVPPDYYSATGQLWGNPLYDWTALAADGYRWWLDRIRATLSIVDILRIDHFRGFQAYWSIPKGEKTAINGKWLIGPGQDFFTHLQDELGENLPIIAEDLGVITPSVEKLRDDNGLPGMKVLQFAFCDGAEVYLPYSYSPNCVCYVATHDNDTTRGWYDAVGPDYAHMDNETITRERDRARRYLGRDGSDISWDLMRLALQSVADTTVLLMQDILNLGNASRMNRPGIGEGQWAWRLTSQQLESAPSGALRDMVFLYGRQPEKKEPDPVEDVEVEG